LSENPKDLSKGNAIIFLFNNEESIDETKHTLSSLLNKKIKEVEL
jgi:hypothetical protein